MPKNEEPKENSKILHQLTNYIFNNLTTTILSAGTLLGIFIFLPYYASIGYFPNLNWNETIAYLIVGALTGIFIVISISLGINSIGLYLKLYSSNTKSLPNAWDIDNNKVDLKNFFRWYIFPAFIGFITFITIGTLLGVSHASNTLIFWLMIVLMVLPTIVMSFWHWIYHGRQWNLIFKTLGYTLAFLFVSWMTLLLSYGILNTLDVLNLVNFHHFFNLIIASILSCALLLLLNTVWLLDNNNKLNSSSNQPREDQNNNIVMDSPLPTGVEEKFRENEEDIKNKKIPFFIFGGTFLVLVFMICIFVNFGKEIVKIYGIGNIDHAAILVNDEGKDIFESIGISVVKSSDNIWQIKDINILSTLGSDFYLQYSFADNNSKKFSFPKRDIFTYYISK